MMLQCTTTSVIFWHVSFIFGSGNVSYISNSIFRMQKYSGEGDLIIDIYFGLSMCLTKNFSICRAMHA